MRLIRKFNHDARGSVLMLTGLAILILFAVAGAGVDFGRQQLVRMKLQNASDAAAVAAASMPESTTVEQRRQVALRYYNLNFPSSYLGVARPSPLIEIGNQITVDASATLATNFIANVGVNQLESQGRTVVDRAEERNSVYDVLLVMDNSGSMADITTAPAFAELSHSEAQNARNLFVLKCRAQEADKFAAFCNVSNTQTMADGRRIAYGSPDLCRNNAPINFCDSYVDGPNPSAVLSGYGFTGNTRLNALRAVARNFIERIIDDGEPGSRIGIVNWNREILQTRPLTENANQLRQDITNMAAYEGTNPYLAMQEVVAQSRDFANNHIKAVVLLTDGKPTQVGPRSYSRYPYTDLAGCNGMDFCQPAVSQTTPICTQLKNSGVQVYTIGFFSTSDMSASDFSRSETFLRSCASVDADGNPRYYRAPTGAELDQAFTQILTSLGRIRISQ